MKSKKISLFAFILFAMTISLVVLERHRIIMLQMFPDGSPSDLLAPTDEGKEVSWYDDYFTVQVIDSSTFAIGEPRYRQQNVNYLIVGTERAILFDAGSGRRDIRSVTKTLTDLPMTFIPSHFHWDHVGNGISWDRIALVELPHIRSRVKDGRLKLEWREHLGSAEGYDQPEFRVDEWLTPNEWIDLGDRKLRVLYTPGHTDDSISLLDTTKGYLFSGDFIFSDEALWAFLPNSGMGDYLQGVETVIEAVPQGSRIFGAHRSGPPGNPEQEITDVQDLGEALRLIRAGELKGDGFYPESTLSVHRINYGLNPVGFKNGNRVIPSFSCTKVLSQGP
jgi:glyoxylase-like metal-dependent hydrolase (beta-lactamase superfamily II)